MDRDLLPQGAGRGRRCTLKRLLSRRRFSILSTILLMGILLLTLPVSYAVWREVLGVDAGVDTGDWPVSPTPTVTVTPTPSATLVPPTDPGQETLTQVPPTDIPATEPAPTESLPTDPTAAEVPPTEPPLPEEPTAAPELPPTELPTEPPVENSTPGE